MKIKRKPKLFDLEQLPVFFSRILYFRTGEEAREWCEWAGLWPACPWESTNEAVNASKGGDHVWWEARVAQELRQQVARLVQRGEIHPAPAASALEQMEINTSKHSMVLSVLNKYLSMAFFVLNKCLMRCKPKNNFLKKSMQRIFFYGKYI